MAAKAGIAGGTTNVIISSGASMYSGPFGTPYAYGPPIYVAPGAGVAFGPDPFLILFIFFGIPLILRLFGNRKK